MTLNPFIRDTAYFQVARDRGMMPIAENFDLQFNQMVNYINQRIVPAIEVIVGGRLLGELGNAGTFLFNIGDGTTVFKKLSNEMIDDYELEWNKLKKAPPASILATDRSYEFTAVTATDENQVLVSQDDDAPLWSLLNGNNVTPNSITGNKFIRNTIGAEHLDPNVLGRPLDNEAVQEPYIADQAISGIKTAYGSITPEKIETNLLDQARLNIAFGNGINKDVFTSRNFQDNIINYDDYFGGQKLLSLDNIGDNSLILQQLPDVIASELIDPYHYFADGAVHPYHIMPRSYDTGQIGSYPTAYQISKEKLSPEIRRVLGI